MKHTFFISILIAALNANAQTESPAGVFADDPTPSNTIPNDPSPREAVDTRPTSTTIQLPPGSSTGGPVAGEGERGTQPISGGTEVINEPAVRGNIPRVNDRSQVRAQTPARTANRPGPRPTSLTRPPSALLSAQADLILTQRIQRDLLSRDPAAVRGVTITTQNGVVYLRGQVAQSYDRDMIFGITRSYAQNLPVRNEIIVRPPSRR